MGSQKLTKIITHGKLHAFNAPIGDHGQCRTRSSSCGNQRIQEEDLVYWRGRRKLWIVYEYTGEQDARVVRRVKTRSDIQPVEE